MGKEGLLLSRPAKVSWEPAERTKIPAAWGTSTTSPSRGSLVAAAAQDAVRRGDVARLGFPTPPSGSGRLSE